MFKKILLIFPLLCSLSLFSEYAPDWYRSADIYENRDYRTCPPTCVSVLEEDLCDEPLFEVGEVNLKVKGGPAWDFFTDRGTFLLVDPLKVIAISPPGVIAASPIFDIGKLSKFQNNFKTPGIAVAAEFAVAVTPQAEFFAQFSWTGFKGKTYDADDITQLQKKTLKLKQNQVVFDQVNNISNIAAYAGCRLYWNSGISYRFNYFFGGKVGYLQRNNIHGNLIRIAFVPGTDPTPPSTTVSNLKNIMIFLKDNTVSGGVIIGFDVCVNEDIFIQVSGEFIASGSFKNNQNAVILNNMDKDGIFVNASNLIIPQTGAELTIPLFVGFGINF